MIKFFRQIRQNLLIQGLPAGQAGKTTRYFKYAIGEIILVVIGILIALQINNWNEERKAAQVETNFLENILVDLQKDEERLNYYNKFHNNRITCLDTMLTYVRNPYKTMGIEKFSQYAEPLFYSVNATQYVTTFESAKAMGTFNSFKNKEILKALSQYYADFIIVENSFNAILRLIENKFEPLMYTLPESYITPKTGDLVITEEDVKTFYQKIASIKDYRNLTPDYNAFLRTPQMENCLIGDIGRTVGAIANTNARLKQLQQLQKDIASRLKH